MKIKLDAYRFKWGDRNIGGYVSRERLQGRHVWCIGLQLWTRCVYVTVRR